MPTFRLSRLLTAGALVGALLTASLPTVAWSQAAAPQSAEQRAEELKEAWAAADKVATMGPASVKLLDQAEIAISAQQAFVPAAEASRVLRAYGNTVGSNLAGLVVGTGSAENWLVVIRFVRDGYIKDDDAKEWNADDLLTSLKEGTAESNKDRVQRGFPKLEVVGWVEKPAYDAATHRLVWSLSLKQEGQPASGDLGVNYNTYALGRHGYFSLNLLTSQKDVEREKAVAHALLGGLGYLEGRRYGDFDVTTDKTAGYGLAALVGGAAVAKKLGFFAAALALLVKFGKFGAIAIGLVGAGLYRLLRGRKRGDGQQV